MAASNRGKKPRLLDLFSGAGGCARGYQLAGFHVTGVDIEAQPRYAGDHFIQADALEFMHELVSVGPASLQYDAIHASPPCQAHSTIAKQIRKMGWTQNEHPDLVPQTRELLQASGLPYVIENVVGAELVNPIVLCGSSFGLNVRRHRLFELHGFSCMAPPCAHHWQTPRFRSLDSRRHLKSVVEVVGTGSKHDTTGLASVVGVHGNQNYSGERALREWAMQIDWMSPYELTQAIPPAYTEHIGEALMDHLKATVAA